METKTSKTEMSLRQQQRLRSLSQTCDRVGKSRWWVRQQVLAGTFPKPIYMPGSRHPQWLEYEIDDYIDRLIAARDGRVPS